MTTRKPNPKRWRAHFVACLVAISFIACDDDKVKDEVLYPDNLNPEPEAVTTNLPAATIGSMPAVNFMAALNERLLTKQAAIDATTRIVLVHNSHLATIPAASKEAILEVYNRGGDIVLVEPEIDDVEAFSEFLNHSHMAAASSQARHFADIYAFNKRNNNYMLGDIHPDGSEITDLDPAHYGNIMNPFIEWLNKNAADTRSTTPTRATTEPADLMKTFDYQTLTTSFPMTVNATLAHVVASSTDNLSKTGTVQVVTTVYPIHAFDDQASPGDYYLMHQEVTIPNGSWYNGTWTNKHGGVYVRLCAYFMQNFAISNYLVSGLTGAVALTPSPTTTVGSTSYTSGVSWHIDASVTGGGSTKEGPAASATIGGGVEVSNSQTRNISDVDVRNLCSGATAAWGLDFNNLASYNANLSINPPAAASRSTQMLYTDWVWYFPSIRDNSTTTNFDFYINLSGIKWGGSHFFSSNADFSTGDYYPSGEPAKVVLMQASFSAPNRTPTGQLKLKNNDINLYLSEVKIWKSDAAVTTTPITIAGSIAPGDDTELWLPTGTYKMQLKIGTTVYHTSSNFTITRAGVFQLNGGTNSPDFATGAL
jgi:hypothetical protein